MEEMKTDRRRRPPRAGEYIQKVRVPVGRAIMCISGLSHLVKRKRVGCLAFNVVAHTSRWSGHAAGRRGDRASNTYVASVLAITDNGLVPVFVEPSIHTYNLDTSLVERAVTARTRAIMVVHLYGRVCWDECLKDVAARYGLKIVEDNAQAFGAVSPVAGLQGSFHTGALGNAAGLSFYPTKFGRDGRYAGAG